MKKITIRKFTLKDADSILKIFNESVSKGLTETKKKIQLDEHIKWLKKKLFSKKDIIYVCKIYETTAGLLDLITFIVINVKFLSHLKNNISIKVLDLCF